MVRARLLGLSSPGSEGRVDERRVWDMVAGVRAVRPGGAVYGERRLELLHEQALAADLRQ